jgi:hypothetical protein
MRHKKTKGTLYLLARQAKTRMRNYSKEKSIFENMQYINSYNEQDQILYKKICKMLDEDRIVINPIKELIDKKYYDSLSLEAKQKYIFDLSDKYREMKERYIKEHSYISKCV